MSKPEIRHYKKTLVTISILIIMLFLLTWAVTPNESNYGYTQAKGKIIDGDYLLRDATTMSIYSTMPKKRTDTLDLHLLIPREHAQELLSRKSILHDCTTPKAGCPEKTWSTYGYYVASYGKTYARTNTQGKAESRDNNPAVPYLSKEPDVSSISCTMYQIDSTSAYGICLNPNTGDLWYHEHKNW